MEYEDAKAYRDRITTAVEASRRDSRMRQMAHVVVHEVVSNLDDREDLNKAQNIAMDAALMMLAMVYSEDAEIARLRAERDAYKAHLEKVISLTPMPFTFPTEAAS